MTDKLDLRIDCFFVDQMLPLAAKAKAEGARFLVTGLEADAPSYYVNRERKTMSKADFETGGFASIDTAAADLQSLWPDAGDLGLGTLAPGMAALAQDLRAVAEETRDVSNFIYVMY